MEKKLSQEENDLQNKIADVRQKKGGVDPAIIINFDKDQLIEIVLKVIKPPLKTGDYVALKISDEDFINIVRTFQKIKDPKVILKRKFQPAEGGISYSEMKYYSTLEMIERFVEDIYGISQFFRKGMGTSLLSNIPLISGLHEVIFRKYQQDPSIIEKRPHTSVFPLIDDISWIASDKFEKIILPFIDAVFMWQLNKERGLSTQEFREAVQERISRGDTTALYGNLTEVYVSGLYIFDKWDPLYIDRIRKDGHGKLIDWVFQRGSQRIGIECKDNRQATKVSPISIEGMIDNAIKKFTTKETNTLNLDRKILWINITEQDYTKPSLSELDIMSGKKLEDPIVGILSPSFSLGSNTSKIDGLILNWREKEVSEDGGFDYHQRYVISEGVDCKQDLPQLYSLIHVRPGIHFFMRSRTYPEPQWGPWGSEETIQ